MKKPRPAKKPTESQNLGEYEGEELSPDEVNPDWPKRTPDTMDDILALIRKGKSEESSASD